MAVLGGGAVSYEQGTPVSLSSPAAQRWRCRQSCFGERALGPALARPAASASTHPGALLIELQAASAERHPRTREIERQAVSAAKHPRARQIEPGWTQLRAREIESGLTLPRTREIEQGLTLLRTRSAPPHLPRSPCSQTLPGNLAHKKHPPPQDRSGLDARGPKNTADRIRGVFADLEQRNHIPYTLLEYLAYKKTSLVKKRTSQDLTVGRCLGS